MHNWEFNAGGHSTMHVSSQPATQSRRNRSQTGVWCSAVDESSCTCSADTDAENCLRHWRNCSALQPSGMGRVVLRDATKSIGVCDASWMAL